MDKYIRIAAFLFLPLLLAVGILEIANYGYDKILRQEFVRIAVEEGTTVDEKDMPITSRQICRETRLNHEVFDEHFCQDVSFMFWGELLAFALKGVYLLYVCFVTWLGKSARGNRERLLLFFRPAMYFTSLLSGGVLLANVIVWLVALFYIQAAFMNMIYLKILVLLGVAGMIGLFMLAKAIWFTLKSPVQLTEDLELKQEEYPQLWELVRRVAANLHAREPDHILVGMDSSFYATGIAYLTPNGVLRREEL